MSVGKSWAGNHIRILAAFVKGAQSQLGPCRDDDDEDDALAWDKYDQAANALNAYAALLDQQASAKTQPAVSDAPISIEAVTAACDAYTESAVEHGWERETIEDILRNDDMRAAIAAAIAVIKEPQA